MKLKHSEYMDIALTLADTALNLGEVPVGCVIVKDDVIIAKAHNMRETDHTALGHAEIYAIKEACEKLCSWRLDGCRLYVTLEPCPMCMGAILNARITEVIFGAYDIKAGCCGTAIDLRNIGDYSVNVLSGINELKCKEVLQNFFKKRRL